VAREVVAERRALDRLSPLAQLASARERVGLLLDRGTRAIIGTLGTRRTATERLAVRVGPTLPARLARERGRLERADALDPSAIRRVAAARASLGTAAAALAVLGPQATLDRGYSIVRRADDARIVRDPVDAPPGTRLALRVARGDLPATADDR
jgi:exodeoxyribonuclease VII large subunit